MDAMLYILGVVPAVLLILGYVRRTRLPEILVAPPALGTCPGAPCSQRSSGGAVTFAPGESRGAGGSRAALVARLGGANQPR